MMIAHAPWPQPMVAIRPPASSFPRGSPSTTSAALTVAPNSTTAWPRSEFRRSSSMEVVAVMAGEAMCRFAGSPQVGPWDFISDLLGRLYVRDLHHQGRVRGAAADPA